MKDVNKCIEYLISREHIETVQQEYQLFSPVENAVYEIVQVRNT